MNLEIVKKLIKLANNNPNEHEANSAARKVCRELDGYDFNTISSPPKQETPKTWNDVRRSSKPQWKSGESYPFEDWFGKWQEDELKRRENAKKEQKIKEEAAIREEEYRNQQTYKYKANYYDEQGPVNPNIFNPKWTGFGSDPEKNTEKAEWVFNPSKMEYTNLRTGMRMSALEFHKKFG